MKTQPAPRTSAHSAILPPNPRHPLDPIFCPRSVAVIGASDNHGAYPATRPVNIPELAATVYRLMGINTNTDLRIRPFLGDAAPMAELI